VRRAADGARRRERRRLDADWHSGTSSASQALRSLLDQMDRSREVAP
jgi:hypothetical protein